jgi:hypothetical protein
VAQLPENSVRQAASEVVRAALRLLEKEETEHPIPDLPSGSGKK